MGNFRLWNRWGMKWGIYIFNYFGMGIWDILNYGDNPPIMIIGEWESVLGIIYPNNYKRGNMEVRYVKMYYSFNENIGCSLT